MLQKRFAAAREHFSLHKNPRPAAPTQLRTLEQSSSEVNDSGSDPHSDTQIAVQSGETLQDSELSAKEHDQQTEDADAGYVESEPVKKPSRIADFTFKMISIGVVVALIVSLAVVESRDTAANITSDTYFYGDSPPIYPSPKGTGTRSWMAAYSKAATMVSRMTLQEKNVLTAGTLSINNGCSGNIRAVDRVKFPGMCLSDAGNGLRSADFVNAYPAGLHAGASWNKELTRRRAVHMGLEFRKKGVNVALGPVVGPLGRVTTGGRNWEGFAADPYLSGQLAFEHVQGMQGVGVITSTKHYIGNEQELWRNPGSAPGIGKVEAVSSNIDDRTMHELYLWPFQDAVRAGSGCIMCSYQRINNSYGCQNSKTLNGLLKEELGFQGFVVSDWSAQHAGYAGAVAGMDMVMPNTHLWGKKLLTAINNGSMPKGRLDDMATRTLAAWYQMGQDADDFPKPGYGMPGQLYKPHKPVDARSPASKSVLREGAREGHVLVKNDGNILPLKKPKLLSLFGYDALAETSLSLSGITVAPPLDSQIAKFNLWVGGGSGANAPAYLSDPFSALSQKAFEDDTSVIWDFESNKPLVNGASDACLVFLNAFASEGYDRPGIEDDESDRLVENVAKSCENTIVVMHNAGTRTVGSWVDNENVKAIIFGHLPGQDSGRALVDLLYGKESFSGKLPYTVAKKPQDYGKLLYHDKPAGRFYHFPQSDFSEGVYIDYRAFDKKRLTPQYPFGFGLTYTTFKFSELSVNSISSESLSMYPPDAPIQQGGNPRLFDVIATASCTIANTGKMAAMEVGQLYVGIPNAPAKQLRGFEKVLIEPGAGITVTFNLTRRDLSIWDTKRQAWKLQSGTYKFYTGNSVENVPLKATLSI